MKLVYLLLGYLQLQLININTTQKIHKLKHKLKYTHFIYLFECVNIRSDFRSTCENLRPLTDINQSVTVGMTEINIGRSTHSTD